MASAATLAPLLPVTNPAAGGSGSAASSDTARRGARARTVGRGRSCWTGPPSPAWTPSLKPPRGYAATSATSASTTHAVIAFSLVASLRAHPFSLLVLIGILDAWCFLYVFRAPTNLACSSARLPHFHRTQDAARPCRRVRAPEAVEKSGDEKGGEGWADLAFQGCPDYRGTADPSWLFQSPKQ